MKPRWSAHKGFSAGQSTLEFLLVSILGFLVLGAIVGTKKDGNGIPATLKRASPRLGGKIEDSLQTGGGFFGKEKWAKPPPGPLEK